MIVTREYLLKYRTKRNGWTKKQLKAVGVDWPPEYGWMDKIIGLEINTYQSTIFQLNGMNSNSYENQIHSNEPKKQRKSKTRKLNSKNKRKLSKKSKKDLKKQANFYNTKQWRDIRYKAFKIHGRQCLCCGAKPPQTVLHVDHIIPRSIRPDLELDINNLQILCEDCNLGKSNKDSIDYRIVKPD